MESIPIFLPDADAKLFLVFQENFDTFATLIEADVFTQRNATILMDFDSGGVLQNIRRNDYLYSRKHK